MHRHFLPFLSPPGCQALVDKVKDLFFAAPEGKIRSDGLKLQQRLTESLTKISNIAAVDQRLNAAVYGLHFSYFCQSACVFRLSILLLLYESVMNLPKPVCGEGGIQVK